MVVVTKTPTEAAPLARSRRVLAAALMILMLGQMAAAMLVSARQESPIVDEPVYVGAALAYTQWRDLNVNPEHPPLAKLVSATGLIVSGARVKGSPNAAQTEWQFGDSVMYRMGNDPKKTMFAARVPIILCTLLFGLVVFLFARDLFGTAGGLLALALYAFSPDIIAHGSLATNDVLVAGFLLTTFWLLWRARSRPMLYLPLAGIAFGCALSSKMTALTAAPIVAVVAGVSWWAATGASPRRLQRSAVAAAAVGAISLAVVWALYLIIDPGLSISLPRPSGAVGLLPLPTPYLAGLDIQLHFEDTSFDGYLFGEHFTGSRWYYLPAALLIKMPLGMLVLWAAAATAILAVRRLRPYALYVLLAPAVLLAVALTGSRSFGTRYVIYLPMFLAVAAGCLMTIRWAKRPRLVPVAAAVLAAYAAVSSAAVFPYYLPYANEAFGGPSQTYKYLNDSNVDWGQDLQRLGDYLRDTGHGKDPIWLIYKGRGQPAAYGVTAKDPLTVPADQVHGLLAVSAMRISLAPDRFASLIGERRPIAVIGHTIFVYQLS